MSASSGTDHTTTHVDPEPNGSNATAHGGTEAGRPGPSAGTSRPQTHTFWLTSALDFRSHAVTDLDMEAGLLADQGVYLALCGATLPPCPMVTPDGEPCTACYDLHKQQVAERLAERKRRNRWWRRLARRVRRG